MTDESSAVRKKSSIRVVDEAMAAAAEVAALPEGTLERALEAVPPETGQAMATVPTALAIDTALPNPNVPAAQSYYNETQIKLATLSQKLMLLENEMEAIEAKYMVDVDDLTNRRNAQLADLQKQVDDHKLAKAMATAPIAIYEEAQQT